MPHQGVICYYKLFDSLEKAIDAALFLSAKGYVPGLFRGVEPLDLNLMSFRNTKMRMHANTLIHTLAWCENRKLSNTSI